MDLYNQVANASSAFFTRRYSTSFSFASRLFPPVTRPHIYNIYGLVRNADEIVDTYTGKDKAALLDQLEAETYAAIKRGFSPNLSIHAFAMTTIQFGIEKKLIRAFFTSMRLDLKPQRYTPELYKTYIHGSAEVVGLMCLRVFCDGDDTLYKALSPGACALGSAFQKVNFLRDLADDNQRLQRTYFPNVSYESFDETDKQKIIEDIRKDFAAALPTISKLPQPTRAPVRIASTYYLKLLAKLEKTPVAELKQNRVRLPDWYKFWLLTKVYITSKVVS